MRRSLLLAALAAFATALSTGAGAASEQGSARALTAGAEAAGKGSKVPRGAVRKLGRASCPAPYAVRKRKSWDAEEIRDARHGRFRIGGTDVRLKRKINWRMDPVRSASFRARLHDLRWLDVLLYDYRANGHRSSLRRAKRIAVNWIKNNPLHSPTTDRTWFDKVVGDRSAYLAYVTRAARCEGMVKRVLARKMLSSLVTHGRYLKRRKNYTRTNRGLFMDMGLLLTGKQVRFLPGATKWRRGGEKRFAKTVNALTFAPEGFWLEHSTTYQFLVANILDRYLGIRGVERPHLNDVLQRMRRTMGWLTMPDKRWLQAGNSYQDKSNKLARQLAREQRGLHLLPRSGLGFARKGKRYLAVLADFHGPTHKHSDELSFDLYDKGRRVVSDTGMYSKDPSRFLNFQRSAQAHSTLVVDGEDFSRNAADAYGSGIEAGGTGDGWFAIEATNPLVASQGVSHTRLYLYKPGTALVVADRVRSPSGSHDYRRYLQLGQGLKLDTFPERLALSRKGKKIAAVFSTSTDAGEERRIVKGRDEPAQGLIFPDFRDRDERWTAWFNTSGADLDHLITVSLKPNKLPRASFDGPLDANPVRIAVSDTEGTAYTLVVTRSGDQLTVTEEPAPDPPLPPYLP